MDSDVISTSGQRVDRSSRGSMAMHGHCVARATDAFGAKRSGTWPSEFGREEDTRVAAREVLSAAREELARFVAIIGELNCHAVLRDADEREIALYGSGAELHPHAVSLTEPIHDADGSLSASIGLRIDPSVSQDLLRSLIRATTRAITERLFRLHFSRLWVIAGRHPDEPNSCVLLALDGRQNVVGADQNARRLLPGCGGREGRMPSFASLFALGISRLSHRRADTVLTLRSMSDDVQWTLLVTPPGPHAQQTPPSAEVLQHTRPRVDAFGRGDWSVPCDDAKGLPLRLVRRIEEYVDANLHATLNVGDLAVKLGVSASHFARSFHKAVGLTPHNYVMQRRLLRAQELLLTTNRSLVDIALVTGFSDQSHFSRRFHQSVGLPPRAFRTRHR